MVKTIGEAIIEEAQIEFAKNAILRLGRKRIGPPSQAVEGVIWAIDDLDRLDRMIDRFFEVKSWAELLETE